MVPDRYNSAVQAGSSEITLPAVVRGESITRRYYILRILDGDVLRRNQCPLQPEPLPTTAHMMADPISQAAAQTETHLPSQTVTRLSMPVQRLNL